MDEEIKQCSCIACKQHIEYNKSIRGIRKAPINKCINQKEMKKEFTKEDLKSGMWVECRNGYRYLLIQTEEELCGYRDKGTNNLCPYNNDLTYRESEWDIIKVWHYDNPMNTNEADFGVDKLVWERNTKKDQIKSKIDEIQSIVDEMQEDINEHLEKINKLKEELK